MMSDRRYRIFGARYELSDKLIQNPPHTPGEKGGITWPDELTAKPKVFHIEITQDRKRVAFLTRKTYAEAKQVGEEYAPSTV